MKTSMFCGLFSQNAGMACKNIMGAAAFGGIMNPQRRHARREEKISEGGFLRKEIFIPIRFSARAALQRKKICILEERLL